MGSLSRAEKGRPIQGAPPTHKTWFQGQRTWAMDRLEKLDGKVEASLTSGFYKLGLLVGRYPMRVLVFNLILLLIGMSGFSQFKEETRGDKLWIPDNTQSQIDQAAYLKIFPPTGRFSSVILEPEDSGNALDRDNLIIAMQLWDEIKMITSEVEGTTYTYEEVCVQDNSNGHPCVVFSVLEKWNYDLATLQADADIVSTINTGSTTEELSRYLGAELIVNDAGAVTGAKALQISVLLKSQYDPEAADSDYADPIPEDWEQGFLAVTQECPAGMNCFSVAFRSLDDEFWEAVDGDINLIIGSWFIIMLYLIANLSGKPFLRSRIALSLGSILCIGFSITWAIGMASFFGYLYSPMHTLLPFILLGLGVDDSFVIANAFEQTDESEPLDIRMADALSHAGVSVTVTSITDLAAFMVSSSSSLPALESFCVYAALGILMVYYLQCTLFSAFLVWDAHRLQQNRYDCCCCIKSSSPPPPIDQSIPPEDRSYLSRFLHRRLGPFIVKPVVALLLFTFFGVVLGFMSYGMYKIGVGDLAEAFVPDGSYLLDTYAKQDQYFGSLGIPFEVVTPALDYPSIDVQVDLAGIRGEMSGVEDSAPFIQDPNTSASLSSWFDNFISWAAASGTYQTAVVSGFTVLSDPAEFYPALNAFLNDPAGFQYQRNVVFSDATQTSIIGASITAEYNPKINGDGSKSVDAMKGTRDLVSSWEALAGAFPWAFDYLAWATTSVIYGELLRGLSFSLLSVLVIVMLLLVNARASALVFLCVIATIVDVLGTMYFLGLSIDSVSVINLVLAVGLSVDYAAHIGHSFMLKTGTRKERAVAALGDIGVAVLNGGLSTFLAVMLLSISKSYVFRVFFLQFAATVVFGLSHGMLVLPAMLSLIGPKPYASAVKKAEAKLRAIRKGSEGSQTSDDESGGSTGFESRDISHGSSHSSRSSNSTVLDARSRSYSQTSDDSAELGNRAGDVEGIVMQDRVRKDRFSAPVG